MELWQAVVLGVVQGFTEFFPVSSDGHLVMAENLLGLTITGLLFTMAVHIATLLSVVIVFRAKIWKLILGMAGKGEESSWRYIMKVVAATIPAVIVGFFFKDWFEQTFQDVVFTGSMILVTGSVVWTTRWARRNSGPVWSDWVPIVLAAAVSALTHTIVPFIAVFGAEAIVMLLSRLTTRGIEIRNEPTWTAAVLMGVAQALAILPGVSRSGGTVTSGLWSRVDPVATAEFSFMMSIPAILGATTLTLFDLRTEPSELPVAPIIAGMIAAGLAGILAIRVFVKLLEKQNFHVFAYYCWVVGTLFLLFHR
jgi:undecaprenyl-diphosphatase